MASGGATTATGRRWSRFSLRALFLAITLVAVMLGWLTWNWNQVRERERIIQFLLHPDDEVPHLRHDLWFHQRQGVEPPWIWRRLGATQDYYNIWPRLTDRELEELQQRMPVVFPDYELIILDPAESKRYLD